MIELHWGVSILQNQNYNTMRSIPLNCRWKILISTWFQILELSSLNNYLFDKQGLAVWYRYEFMTPNRPLFPSPFFRSSFSRSLQMSEDPFQAVFQTFAKVSNSVQTHLSNLIGQPHHTSPTTKTPLISVSSSSKVGPSENDFTHLQPQDIINKVTTLVHNILHSFF